VNDASCTLFMDSCDNALQASMDPKELIKAAPELAKGGNSACRYRPLGSDLELEREPRWRRDPVSGVETGLPYFRRVPYLEARRTVLLNRFPVSLSRVCLYFQAFEDSLR
jgi:hypothetical protein